MSIKIHTKNQSLIGVISDTHGRLQPAAIKALKGTDLIIHAGDVGKPEVLESLQDIAPVIAVRGNMDIGDWIDELPETKFVEVGSLLLYVIHDIYKLDIKPDEARVSAVISGHSHRPSLENHNGVLFLNPGSATLPRFNNPASVALLQVKEKSLSAQFLKL